MRDCVLEILSMRPKRPRIARLDEVNIRREGEYAIVEFRDGKIGATHIKLGPKVHKMTDDEILLLFNQTIALQIRMRDESGEYVAIEVPPGSPQVKACPESVNGWVPRGGVLRCSLMDGGGDDGSLPTIYIDEEEFSWEDFGRMLCVYAGWGMRVVFVPDDELEMTPKVSVREPKE